MKKFIFIFIIIILTSTLLLSSGCSPKYRVVVWNVDKVALQSAQEELELAKLVDNKTLIVLAEEKINKVLNTPRSEIIKAKKIIDYTSTSVRFID